MKKKVFSVVICTIIAVVCLAGCGSDSKLANSKYVGTWKGSSVEYGEMNMELKDVFPKGFSIELTGDGKITLDVNGEKTTGKWDESDKGIIVDQGSDNEVELTDRDGNLVITYSDLSIVCVKQK